MAVPGMRKPGIRVDHSGWRRWFVSLSLLAVAALVLAATALPLLALPRPEGRYYTALGEKQISDRYGVASPHLCLYEMTPEGEMPQVEAEMQKMEEAGIKWLRTVFAWTDIEVSEGDWVFDKFDKIVQLAKDHDIKILAVLIDTPMWANGNIDQMFVPPANMDKWREYVKKVCTQPGYQGTVAAYEVWNEPDALFTWPTGIDPVEYVELLRNTSEVIRAYDPGAKVVMAGVTNPFNPYDQTAKYPEDLPFPDESFLYRCLQEGAAQYVDAIAFHDNNDIFISRRLEYMRTIGPWLDAFASSDLEVWITECGFNRSILFWLNEENISALAMGALSAYASEDVDRSTPAGDYVDMLFYHNLRDELLDNAGLLQSDLTEYPVYKYYKTFEAVLGEAVGDDPGAATFSVTDPNFYEYCFVRPDGDLVIVVWMDGGSVALNLTVNDPDYADPMLVDLTNAGRIPMVPPVATRDAQGRVVITQLPVGQTPQVIELDSLTGLHLFSINATDVDAGQDIYISDISGAGFQADTAVRLEMDGTVVPASSTTLVSSTQLDCSFSLVGAPTGAYDVVVENSTDEARLVDALNVAPAGSGCGSGSGAVMIVAAGAALGLVSMREWDRRRKRKKMGA